MFKLPELPYAFDALEPHIDAVTMEIHHDRHHGTYVDKLNDALKDHEDLLQTDITELLANDLDRVPEAIRAAVRNNGGGHANHSMFWEIMSPDGGGEPSGELGEAINKQFGSFKDFQAKFKEAALGRFGSGWAWLCAQKGALHICTTANQDNPASQGHRPIMGIDVWEHAYYLKYQNKRPDYVDAWWNVANWPEIARRFAQDN